MKYSVDWIPTSGYATFALSFQRGTKEIKLDNKYIEIYNYSNVVKSHKAILTTIRSEFENNILDQFDGSYKSLSDNIKKNLTESLEVISNITDYLKNLDGYFKEDFEEFKKNVSFYSFSYVNLNNFLNNFSNFFTNIFKVKNRLYSFDLNTYLNFFTQFSSFIIKTNNLNNFSFDFYYKIKEIFDKVNYLIKNIRNILNNSFNDKYLLLKNYVNEFNLEKVNEIKIILDAFKNNEILNASSNFINNFELVNKNYTNFKELN